MSRKLYKHLNKTKQLKRDDPEPKITLELSGFKLRLKERKKFERYEYKTAEFYISQD